MSMTFYSVQIKENVDVPDDQVEVVTMKNGKKAARATVDREGKTLKLFKFLPGGDTAGAGATEAAGSATGAAEAAKKTAKETTGTAKKAAKETAGAAQKATGASAKKA